MSGHSKWSTIKRRKGAVDAKRSKLFSRVIKEITVAVKDGGIDPDTNPRLRLAIQNAKGVNMPKDNILKAINKADKDESLLEEISFEGYSPGGIGIFIECLTDNKNRSVSSVRSVFNKYNGTLSTNGSLNFMFERKGVFSFELENNTDIDSIELALIDAGAEEIEKENGTVVVTAIMEDFGNVNNTLMEMNIEVENAELQRIPLSTKELKMEEALRVLKMVDSFENLDDVQNVYHNLEMNNELIEYLNK